LLREVLKKAMKPKSAFNGNNMDDFVSEEDRVHIQQAERAVKKRQCANCTCSLSKAPAAQSSAPDTSDTSSSDKSLSSASSSGGQPPKYKSSCGSCGLGDAFRCAGCPYKGLPPFEEGKEFKFDDNLNDL